MQDEPAFIHLRAKFEHYAAGCDKAGANALKMQLFMEDRLVSSAQNMRMAAKS